MIYIIAGIIIITLIFILAPWIVDHDGTGIHPEYRTRRMNAVNSATAGSFYLAVILIIFGIIMLVGMAFGGQYGQFQSVVPSTVPLGMEYWTEPYPYQDAQEIVHVLNGVPTSPDVEALKAKWTIPPGMDLENWEQQYSYQDAEEIVWVLSGVPYSPYVEVLRAKWMQRMAEFGQSRLSTQNTE